jgi:hypothetical protein
VALSNFLNYQPFALLYSKELGNGQQKEHHCLRKSRQKTKSNTGTIKSASKYAGNRIMEREIYDLS